MKKRIHLITKLGAFMILAGTTFILGGSVVSAAPATFTVTNTNDSGAGSLRQAMTDANENGNAAEVDTIEFNIPGAGPHVITVDSVLPSLTQSIVLDGYSQPGSVENTLIAPAGLDSVIKIEIDGSALPDGTDKNGIELKDGCSDCTVRGLSIHSFPANAISGEVSTVVIEGNYLGVDASGNQDKGNGNSGITSQGQIGGTTPAARNLISGNTGLNVQAFAATFLGTPNGSTTKIQGNLVGTNRAGEVDDGFSQGTGIFVYGDATEVLIGGTETGAANTVRGVAGMGIGVGTFTAQAVSLSIVPSKIAILGNRIDNIGVFDFANFGNSNQGIDLLELIDTTDPPDMNPDDFGDRGPNTNDEGDADIGPNGKINTPVLKTAQQTGDQLTVTYDLDVASSPSDTYRIEFFASSNRSIFGSGPGETYLGSATPVAPGDDKTATLTLDGDFTLDALSATVTAIDATTSHGFGATSEFAQNVSIGSNDDFDADGVADSVEDGAPNNGDGNNDGTPDKEQPTVTSYVAAGSVYATLSTEGCSENGTVSSLRADTLEVKDNGYEYPFGLADFTLYCSRGDTVNVTMLVHSEDDPEKYLPRKFNPNTNVFSDIPGSALTTETIGESTALQLVYSAQDGGDLDDDGEENGIIVDPVGLATEKSGVLANTGTLLIGLIPLGILMIVGAVYTYVDYRKHRKPLTEADASLAASYTYWHHLKLVAIPMAKYRLSIKVEKKKTLPALSP